ncbi:histidine phosphatase family protein, partial [Patescibacteria group bacterium]|nr:histidine phosphatase family protein [Patescibacteria group bacterium]
MEIVGKDNYCRLYLIRHGQSTANKKQITEGHLNSPLNKTGIEQAQKVAEQFREIEFDEIHSSDLLRAKQTAEIVKSERDIPIQISELLKERHFGSLEGAPWSELERQTSALDKLSKEEIWHHKLDGTM